MPLFLIEGPDNDNVLPLADMKAWLRVDHADDDALIEGMIASAIQQLDGRDGWLNRALGIQTWELRLEAFSFYEIVLPLPPLIAVTSIKYYDTDGYKQTLGPSNYCVAGIGGIKPRVELRHGKSWPGTSSRTEAVIIQYQCGYADEQVPAPIVTALKRMVSSMYENRESEIIGQTVIKLPGGVESNLAPYRVW